MSALPSRHAPSERDVEPSGRHAEFDSFADAYHALHEANVAVTGEQPEFFAEYKIADLARFVARKGVRAEHILDFGSGIGNSIPWFRRHFPQSQLTCADVSARSIAVARARHPGAERHVLVDRAVPLAPHSQDIVFSACVFHHIPHEEHSLWLQELHRIVRRGGLLVIYEHNPANPLTAHAVRTCPLDVNARMIWPGQLRRDVEEAGWRAPRCDYKLFFPRALNWLRPLELSLEWLPLGAQYRCVARRP